MGKPVLRKGRHRQHLNPRQKKWATEVALNALRARVPERSARLALVRVLPDENAQTGKESDHQPDRYHTSDNHVVEEHAGLPFVCRCPMGER